MENKILIYGLTGDDKIIRYVGMTPLRRLEKRRIEHISEAKSLRDNRHKNNWIRKILKNGEDLNIFVLEECDESTWQEKEKFWISKFDNLTNKSEGGEGNSGYKYKLTITEVMDWVKNNIPHINSESKWREYIKNHSLPDFIPSRPDVRYKNDGWISYMHFFNFTNHKKIFISYDELKNIVNKNNIKTLREYKIFRNKNMPSNPNLFYKEWTSCRNFFGEIKEVKENKHKKIIVSFLNAKLIIKDFNFTKKNEYTQWQKLNKNLFLPVNPPIYYKEDWLSWQDFFGNKLPKIINYHKKQKSILFLSYNDTKEWIDANLSVNTESEWRNVTKNLPKFIPKRPDYVYKNQGWEGWTLFFSN